MNYFLFFLSGACVNAEPATDFAAFELFGLRRIFDALLATFFEVFSFLAIFFTPDLILINLK